MQVSKQKKLKFSEYFNKHKEYMNRFHNNPPDICAVCSHYNNVSVLANDHHKKLLKKQKNIYN